MKIIYQKFYIFNKFQGKYKNDDSKSFFLSLLYIFIKLTLSN